MPAYTDPDLLALMRQVTTCPLRCQGILNDPALGIIPRSFYTSASVERVQMLIVGKNPGQAPEWERALYYGCEEHERAGAHIQVVRELFEGARAVASSFHVSLLRRVAAILDVGPTAEQVFARAALTALVKCESESDKTSVLPHSTVDTCAQRFLLREITLYRPAYLLALGGEVYRYLTTPSMRAQHALPVGNLYHPSWTNMKGGEAHYFATEIPRLRTAFLRAVTCT